MSGYAPQNIARPRAHPRVPLAICVEWGYNGDMSKCARAACPGVPKENTYYG